MSIFTSASWAGYRASKSVLPATVAAAFLTVSGFIAGWFA
jgi:hypothetical protein